MFLTLTPPAERLPPTLSIGLIQPRGGVANPTQTSIGLAIRAIEPHHYKLIHKEEWIAVGLLSRGVNRVAVPIHRLREGEDRCHLVLVTKNGPTVQTRDLLLRLRVMEGPGIEKAVKLEDGEGKQISPHFTERLTSSFNIDDRGGRRRRTMKDGSHGPMNPADGSYPWLNSVNVLGVVSALAKAFKRGGTRTQGGRHNPVRRITVSFPQKSPGGEEQTLAVTITLEVTPARLHMGDHRHPQPPL